MKQLQLKVSVEGRRLPGQLQHVIACNMMMFVTYLLSAFPSFFDECIHYAVYIP